MNCRRLALMTLLAGLAGCASTPPTPTGQFIIECSSQPVFTPPLATAGPRDVTGVGATGRPEAAEADEISPETAAAGMSLARKPFITNIRDLRRTGLSAQEIESSGDFINHLLVGGIPVDDPDAFPYAAVLAYDGDYSLAGFCSGFLVAEDWVLTAAHCADAITTNAVVFIGGTNLESDRGEKRQIKGSVKHQCYDAERHRNDISLVKLTRDSTRTALTLAEEPTSLDKYPNDVIMLGWGESRPNLQGIQLRSLDTQLVRRSVCSADYGFEIPGSVVCAGKKGGTLCYGDSGGPLLAKDKKGENLGIAAASFTGECMKPGGFSRLPPQVDWVNDIMTEFAGS